MIGSSSRTEKRVDEFTQSINDLMTANPFELHTVFLDTAIASWLPFLRDLDKVVTHQVSYCFTSFQHTTNLFQSNKAVGITVEDGDEGAEFISIELDDHQEMKEIEDQIADTILCLDSMLDTVTVLGDMYEQFKEHHTEATHILGETRRSAYGTDAVSLPWSLVSGTLIQHIFRTPVALGDIPA